jgi:hypothetical protein
MFIELTTDEGKFIGNVNLLKRVFVNRDNNKTCVVGWNNNGYFEVNESYEEVIEKINSRMYKVLRSGKAPTRNF